MLPNGVCVTICCLLNNRLRSQVKNMVVRKPAKTEHTLQADFLVVLGQVGKDV